MNDGLLNVRREWIMLRRTTTTIAVLALGLALFAGPAFGQEAEGTAEAFARAEAAGVPVSLLESKMAEGRAKGVPMDVIESAIERRTDALIRAASTFEAAGIESAGEADLSVAADALESGVSEAVLQTISQTAPQERRAVAIAALSYLVASGEVPEEALVQVEAALQRGPDALANLSARASAAVEAGGPGAAGAVGADVGVDVGTGGIPAGVPAGRPDGAGPPGGVPVP